MLKELSLSLEIGTENKIEIKCQFHVKDPSLVIAGNLPYIFLFIVLTHHSKAVKICNKI